MDCVRVNGWQKRGEERHTVCLLRDPDVAPLAGLPMALGERYLRKLRGNATGDRSEPLGRCVTRDLEHLTLVAPAKGAVVLGGTGREDAALRDDDLHVGK